MADANILGQNHYQALQAKVRLEPTEASIKPYGSPAIPTIGKFWANVKTQKGCINAMFYVAQGHLRHALLGKFAGLYFMKKFQNY